MGAGKGYLLSLLEKRGVFPREELLNIDFDEFKLLQPEFYLYNAMGHPEAGTMCKMESNFLGELLYMIAVAFRCDFLQDGSLRDFNWYRNVFLALSMDTSRSIIIIGVSAPGVEVRKRVEKRALETGRTVPENFINDKAIAAIVDSVTRLGQMPQIALFIMFDCSGYKTELNPDGLPFAEFFYKDGVLQCPHHPNEDCNNEAQTEMKRKLVIDDYDRHVPELPLPLESALYREFIEEEPQDLEIDGWRTKDRTPFWSSGKQGEESVVVRRVSDEADGGDVTMQDAWSHPKGSWPEEQRWFEEAHRSDLELAAAPWPADVYGGLDTGIADPVDEERWRPREVSDVKVNEWGEVETTHTLKDRRKLLTAVVGWGGEAWKDPMHELWDDHSRDFGGFQDLWPYNEKGESEPWK